MGRWCQWLVICAEVLLDRRLGEADMSCVSRVIWILQSPDMEDANTRLCRSFASLVGAAGKLLSVDYLGMHLGRACCIAQLSV